MPQQLQCWGRTGPFACLQRSGGSGQLSRPAPSALRRETASLSKSTRCSGAASGPAETLGAGGPPPPTPVRCTMATHGTSRDPRRFRLPSHPKMAAPVGPVKFWKPGEGARPVCGAAVRGRRGLRMREFLPGLSVAGAGAKAAALPPAAVGSWGSHGFQTPRVSGETRCPSAAGAWRAARSL